MGKIEECKSKIIFGDNICTFHCELEENHKGNHRETGTLYGQKYIIEWKNKK